MKLYRRLRAEMHRQEVDQMALARWIGVSQRTVVSRMNRNGSDFTLTDAYAILDRLGIDRARIGELFPPGGVDVE